MNTAYMVVGNIMENVTDSEAIMLFHVGLGCNVEKVEYVISEKAGLCYWQNCQETFKTWAELGL